MNKKRKLAPFACLLSLAMAASIGLAACTPQTPDSGDTDNPGIVTPNPENPNPENPTPGTPGGPQVDASEHLKEVTGTVSGDLDAKGQFPIDYNSKAESIEAGNALNVQIASEGFVLLKNKNKALPLGTNEKKLTLFGARSVDLQTGGGGSGANDGTAVEKTLKESMTEAGFTVNEELLNYYSENQVEADVAGGLGGNSTHVEIDPDGYVNDLGASVKQHNDAVIWTISRAGSEGADLARSQMVTSEDKTKHYLELDDNEIKVYNYLKQQREAGEIKKLVVVVNSANAMELGVLQDSDAVDGIIWVGHPGAVGILALGKILNGTVNPSGHLSDIYARDFTKDPTWFNFGDNSQIEGVNGTRIQYYDEETDRDEDSRYYSIEYREGIYYGYRWYETYADDLNAKTAGSGDTWYNQNVVYPYGYGLSYTTFKWELDNMKDTALIDAANRSITMKVKVTNTGDVAGKDVVQVYYTAPYTAGGIEKASANLVTFGKTKLLAPGESETLTMVFYAQDMASFDWNDANKNGFKGYELEKGDYTISIRKNSHEVVDSVTRTVAETIKCTTDLTTGKEIKSLFTGEKGLEAYKSTNASLEKNLVTRKGGLTLPAAATQEDRKYTKEQVDGFGDWTNPQYTAADDKESDIWYVKELPSGWTQAESHEDGYTDVKTKLYQMAGINYQNPQLVNGKVVVGTDEGSKKWEEFMNQLTYDEMKTLLSHGFFKTMALPSIDKPQTGDSDGPAQAKAPYDHMGDPGGTFWASEVVIASSWNLDLAERMGIIVANDCHYLAQQALSGWYGPSMNVHRSVFGGRNFEYYSEDGVHSGLFAAAVINGAASRGIKTYIKHFFLNDQETNRTNTGIQWADEQTMREIYAKPFEIAIKQGGTMAIMDSGCTVGGVRVYGNYAVNELLLRGEWDYKGFVLTDWINSTREFAPLELRSGVDLGLGAPVWFPGMPITPFNAAEGAWEDGKVVVDGNESKTAYYHVRKACQRILYASANCWQNGRPQD